MRRDVIASRVVVLNLVLVRRISRSSRSVGIGPVAVFEQRESWRFADEDGSSREDEEIGDDVVLSSSLSRKISNFSRRSRFGGRGSLEGVLLVGEIGVGMLSSDVLRERSLATEPAERSKCQFLSNVVSTSSKLTSCHNLEHYTCTVAFQCVLVDVEPRTKNR